MENHEVILDMLTSENQEDRVLGATIALKNLTSKEIKPWFVKNGKDSRWYRGEVVGFANQSMETAVVRNNPPGCIYVSYNTIFYTDDPVTIKRFLEANKTTISVVNID